MHWLILMIYLLSPINIEKADHEFHFSKCDIEYSKEDKALQIAMRIFIDDLEEALAKSGNPNLKLCTSKEVDSADSIIQSYLQEKFKITVDEASHNFTFVGKETSEDLMAVWCYLEVVDIEPVENIRIKNSILMDIFDDQKNMVVLKYSKEKKEHFLFQVGEDTGALQLN